MIPFSVLILHVTDVHVVFEGVDALNEAGLTTSSGKNFEFDLIACATGFSIQYMPHL
jgi:hypothetical protein